MKAIKNPIQNNGADANSWAHRLFLIIEQVVLRESARIDEVRYCQTTLPPGLRQGRYMLARLRGDSFATIFEVCYPLVRQHVAKLHKDILPLEVSRAAQLSEADARRSDFPGPFEIIPFCALCRNWRLSAHRLRLLPLQTSSCAGIQSRRRAALQG